MMDEYAYAPVNQQLTYDQPNYDKQYDTNLEGQSDNTYNVDEYYYAELVMKEWQARPSKVAKLYFSLTNIKRIQKKIKREIYNRSHGKFKLLEDQNVLDLLQVMRTIYKEDARDLPTDIVRQVKILNEKTVQYVAPDMITNLKQYYGYLADIKNPINPLPAPLNVNNAGRRGNNSTAQYYGI